jgi:hypothetical protein
MQKTKNNSAKKQEAIDLVKLRDSLTKEETLQEISTFIEELREEVESNEKWLKICSKAEKETPESLSQMPQTIEKIFETLKPIIENTPPGHDYGHILRDTLAGITIANNKLNTAYEVEKTAGIIAAMLHDVATAVFPRYKDTNSIVGHAEVGAWIAYNTFTNLGKNLRKMVAYSIAAHTHYLKPIQVDNYTRMPYLCEPFKEPETGKIAWAAPTITRIADRIDLGGATHFARHLIAEADAILAGGGKNLVDNNFYEINLEHLRELFEINQENKTTLFGQVIAFSKSNFGQSVYSKNDFLFPVASDLFGIRALQIVDISNQMLSGNKVFSSKGSKDSSETVEKVAYWISLSPANIFKPTWEILQNIWDGLDKKTQNAWCYGFRKIGEIYPIWLNTIHQKIEEHNPSFIDLASRIIEKLELQRDL